VIVNDVSEISIDAQLVHGGGPAFHDRRKTDGNIGRLHLLRPDLLPEIVAQSVPSLADATEARGSRNTRSNPENTVLHGVFLS
jgi:hypothetical protein